MKYLYLRQRESETADRSSDERPRRSGPNREQQRCGVVGPGSSNGGAGELQIDD